MPTTFSHVENTKARWEAYGPGFAERHPEVYRSDLECARRADANRKGNERAAEALKATGGDKEAALALLLAPKTAIADADLQALADQAVAPLGRSSVEAGRRVAA